MKRISLLLPICLSLFGCSSNGDNAIKIVEVIDLFNNTTVSPESGKYNLRPYFCYNLTFSLNKSSYEDGRIDTLQNQLKFEYDKNLVDISLDFSHKDENDYIYVTYQLESISSFKETTINTSCYDKELSFTISSNEEKVDIGKTTINTVEESISKYIDSLQFFEYVEKDRLKSVDTSLYSASGGWNMREEIDIKADDVTIFLLDSVYYPKDVGTSNTMLYIGELNDSKEYMAQNPHYALFISDSTSKYPFAHYHSENDSFAFDCYNKKALLLKSEFFKKYEESFYKTQINGLDCYLWKKGEVYIPFDVLNYKEGSIISAFSYGDYIYFVTSLNNN